VRIVVESVKESQGGFESLRITFYRSVVEYSFILIGLYFVFTAKKKEQFIKTILLQNNKALSATE
jgi:prolipoprotein diacylglyceryltransferase